MARYGIAWGAIGAAEFCWNASLDYSLTESNLATWPCNVSKKLTDMQTEITLGLQCIEIRKTH